MNPKYRETVIILNEEEKIEHVLEGKKRQRKAEYTEKRKRKTVKHHKILPNLARRVTMNRYILHILAQVANDTGI